MDKFYIDKSGRLVLNPGIHELLGDEPLVNLSCSRRHLLLGREDDEQVVLAGFLGDMVIPDLLSFFNMFRKTGILHFDLPAGEKSLYFQNGEIVFATSNFPKEDLGELLFATGKVERAALQQARDIAQGRTTLGRVLVESGAVSPKDLWLMVRTQVEGIVYQLFTAETGSFSYRAKALDSEQIIRLSMSTQNIIMEGLRRQDEGALFMRKIISLAHFPKGTDRLPADLSQDEKKFYTYARPGQVTAQDLFRKCGMREFDGMRVLYALLEKRMLTMEEQAATEIGGDLGQVLMIYNSVLKAIYGRVIKKFDGFSEEISHFLRELPQPYSFVLRDVQLNDDGTLDGHRVVQNLAGLEEGDKKKLLADALGELVYMESMAVRRELESSAAQSLIARVQEISNRVKALVGRSD
ncbi:DUF4388 domain-containing protein [Geopsychrobacter electrodiphilus]|uniref:DUF4388 domain-containing protein n=1 Tax=Geopsychrobacter electrodiphilus TaxID=225196 RepID=UPI00035E7A0F|nr:DUF4388 domain-containing protein [Geopsychrobacter electrodiphilus]